MVRSRTDMTIVQEKDYITNTKASGYRSCHIIIRYPLSTALGEGGFRGNSDSHKRYEFLGNGRAFLRYKYSGNIRRSCRTDCITARRRRSIWIGNVYDSRGNHECTAAE